MQQLGDFRKDPFIPLVAHRRRGPVVPGGDSREEPLLAVPVTCWPYIPVLLSQRLSSAVC